MPTMSVEAAPNLSRSTKHEPWLNLVAHLDPRFGGISAIMPSFCSAVAAAGRAKVGIAAFCEPDESFSIDHNLTVERFPLGKTAWLRNKSERQRLMNRIAGSQGVHIHGLWQEHCLLGTWMARTASKPYVVSAHGMLDRWAVRNKQWKKALYSMLIEKHNLQRASCLHALTESEAADYRRSGFRNPIAVVPNGVHVPADGSATAFFDDYPQLVDKKIVLFLGRIHFKKGLDLLCRAWHRIRKDDTAHLVLAGPDFEETQPKIEALIRELGIQKSVSFTGMLNGAQKWGAFHAAHVFVLPSYSEGLSVSVLEAMGSGVPVIVTEQCNVPEVNTRSCGWAIQPDIDQLTRALEQCLCSPKRDLTAMGSNGKATVSERYSWDVVGRHIAAVYEWMLGGAVPSFVDLRFS